jgi:anti-anti-sigma regulatory factor
MKFYLIVTKGKKQGMPIPISVDLFLIGSDRICQLRKRTLGKRHCAFVTRDKKVFVRDMDSGQPTIVNGAAIPAGAEWPLHAGDRVSLGNLEFMIQYRESTGNQKDLEEWAVNCLEAQAEHEIDDLFNPDKFRASVTAAGAAQSILDQLDAMKGYVKGRLRIGHERNVTTVRISDVKLVDESEIALVKRELCDNLNKPNLRVLLDLKNIRKLSSAAVVMLAEVYRWLKPWGSTMAVCRLRPELESAMALLLVDEKIPVFKEKTDAIHATW